MVVVECRIQLDDRNACVVVRVKHGKQCFKTAWEGLAEVDDRQRRSSAWRREIELYDDRRGFELEGVRADEADFVGGCLERGVARGAAILRRHHRQREIGVDDREADRVFVDLSGFARIHEAVAVDITMAHLGAISGTAEGEHVIIGIQRAHDADRQYVVDTVGRVADRH